MYDISMEENTHIRIRPLESPRLSPIHLRSLSEYFLFDLQKISPYRLIVAKPSSDFVFCTQLSHMSQMPVLCENPSRVALDISIMKAAV